MAITTYTELQDAIANWLDDSTLTERIPEFIELAEAEFQRILRVPEMEEAGTLTCVAGTQTVALPTGFRDTSAVWLSSSYNTLLNRMPLGVLQSTYADQVSGRPAAYAIADEKLWLGPIPDSDYTISLIYRVGVPALSDSNTSNWLLDAHPDIYLYASLLQAEMYGWNDARLQLINAKMNQVINQINAEGVRKVQGGVMRMTHGVQNG